MYSPQMNGAAERLNQTVVDEARTLLHQNNIGKSFWPEAVLFFVKVWNRLCHDDQTKTPFELYTGVKPSIRHFKKFGSTAYVGIPRPKG
ncbi:retrovirus-related Pol polyprotein from transposon TNT 1-94 [Trichonephila clavipes]|nr:retrovirus-related Pol polyprotein from transposon TNT 1-94 [Trichonephila clavipes]